MGANIACLHECRGKLIRYDSMEIVYVSKVEDGIKKTLVVNRLFFVVFGYY